MIRIRGWGGMRIKIMVCSLTRTTWVVFTLRRTIELGWLWINSPEITLNFGLKNRMVVIGWHVRMGSGAGREGVAILVQ